jgi:DNA-binding transcriptional regulator YiaG
MLGIAQIILATPVIPQTKSMPGGGERLAECHEIASCSITSSLLARKRAMHEPDQPHLVGPHISPEQSRTARGLLGWSQRTLAAKAHLPLSVVRNFESEKGTPHARALISIKNALGIGPPAGASARLRSRKGEL